MFWTLVSLSIAAAWLGVHFGAPLRVTLKTLIDAPAALAKHAGSWQEYHCRFKDHSNCAIVNIEQLTLEQIDRIIPRYQQERVKQFAADKLRSMPGWEIHSFTERVDFKCCNVLPAERYGYLLASTADFLMTYEHWPDNFLRVSIISRRHCITPPRFPLGIMTNGSPRANTSWPDHWHVWLDHNPGHKVIFGPNEVMMWPKGEKPSRSFTWYPLDYVAGSLYYTVIGWVFPDGYVDVGQLLHFNQQDEDLIQLNHPLLLVDNPPAQNAQAMLNIEPSQGAGNPESTSSEESGDDSEEDGDNYPPSQTGIVTRPDSGSAETSLPVDNLPADADLIIKPAHSASSESALAPAVTVDDTIDYQRELARALTSSPSAIALAVYLLELFPSQTIKVCTKEGTHTSPLVFRIENIMDIVYKTGVFKDVYPADIKAELICTPENVGAFKSAPKFSLLAPDTKVISGNAVVLGPEFEKLARLAYLPSLQLSYVNWTVTKEGGEFLRVPARTAVIIINYTKYNNFDYVVSLKGAGHVQSNFMPNRSEFSFSHQITTP